MPSHNVSHRLLFWAFGVPLTTAGVYLIGGSIFAPGRVYFTMDSGATTTPLVTAALAVIVLIIGIGALTSRRWPMDEAGKRRWAGRACLGIGLAIVVIALADPHEETFRSGRWAALAAGVTVVCAGSLAIVTTERLSPSRGRLINAVAGSMLSCFAFLFLGLSLSERLQGGGEIRLPFFAVETPSWLNRALLGSVGLVFLALAVAAWKQALAKTPDRLTPPA